MPSELHTRNLIVLSEPRSGSCLLVNYLSSNRHVHCYGEVLSDERLVHGSAEGASNASLRAHVARFFRRGSPTYVGAKFLTRQFEDLPITIDDVLEELNDPKVVVIYRSNLLESYVSLRIAQQNHIWYSTTNVNEISILVNIQEFLHYVARQRRRWRNCLQCISGRTSLFYIIYEQLVQATQATMDKVFSFLEIPTAPVYSGSLKQNPRTLREKIANYDALSLYMQEASRWLNFSLPTDCIDEPMPDLPRIAR